MSARWGVQKVRVSDLSRISLSRLEERVGWLGHERDGYFGAPVNDDPPEYVWRDEAEEVEGVRRG